MTVRTQLIIRELEALKDADGKIHAGIAVEWARRHPRSALHGWLEWDDSVAAERYRVDQVRNFLQIHVVDPLGCRRYVSLSIDRPNGGGYRPMQDVVSRQDLRAIMLNDAIDDLERLQRLYQRLPELGPVWRALARLRPRSAA